MALCADNCGFYGSISIDGKEGLFCTLCSRKYIVIEKKPIQNQSGCNKSSEMDTHALYDAIYHDHDGVQMSRILDANPRLLNAVIDDQWHATALHCAADQGLTSLVLQLLQRKGIEIDKRNKNGCTALYYACFFGHLDMLKILLGAKASTELARSTGDTPLYAACQKGHLSAVCLLLEHKAQPDPEETTQTGDTPLYVACQNGHLEAVEPMLRFKANPNKARKDGITPLYVASQNNHLQTVKLLLQYKALPNKSRQDGIAPLWIAAQFGNIDAMKLLLEYGAEPDQPRAEGTTPLYIATEKNHVDIVKMLLELKCSPNSARQNHATPLLSNVIQDRVEIVSLLLDAGAAAVDTETWGKVSKWARSDKVTAMLKAAGNPRDRREAFLAKLSRPKCQRQWARVFAASSGWTAVENVPQVQPAQPLQQFFVEYPGLTPFIGRCMLSYYNNHNTTPLEELDGSGSL